MDPKVREVLDVIDAVLSAEDETAQSLWSVLMALRGPDDEDLSLKKTTTAVIRAAAFPLTATRGYAGQHAGDRFINGAQFCPGGNYITPDGWSHFATHANRGADALRIPRR